MSRERKHLSADEISRAAHELKNLTGPNELRKFLQNPQEFAHRSRRNLPWWLIAIPSAAVTASLLFWVKEVNVSARVSDAEIIELFEELGTFERVEKEELFETIIDMEDLI